MKTTELIDHVIIVGAGIIGLTTAWELARRNRPVCLIDAGRAGQKATSVAAGMLGLTAEVHFGEDDLVALQKASLELYEDYVAELEAASGVDVDYRTEATLMVARDRDDLEALQRHYEYQQSVDLPVQWLDDDELRQRAPALRKILRALQCPRDHRVDPEAIARALSTACRRRGVKFFEDSPVARILTEKGRTRGVELGDGRRFMADQVVVAAGAWSRRIEGIPTFDDPVLRPIRGQIIIVDGGSPPPIDCVVRSPDVYIVPRRDGRLVIGSTMEEKGFAEETTVGAVRTLLDEAWTILPDLDEKPIVDLRSGFRPVSRDDRPIMGPTRLPGLFVATGHGRHGILLAPITGRIMARHLGADSESAECHRCFEPQRFRA